MSDLQAAIDPQGVIRDLRSFADIMEGDGETGAGGYVASGAAESLVKTLRDAAALLEQAQRPVQMRRFEVIDWRSKAEHKGRVFSRYPATDAFMVEMSYQDEGRTLKVFLTDPQPPTGDVQ